jgi:hypothetical protein
MPNTNIRVLPVPLEDANIPIIIPGTVQLVGQAQGQGLYCSAAPADSRYRYRFSGGRIIGIQQYGLTVEGIQANGYCLDKNRSFSAGTYENVGPAEALGTNDLQRQLAAAWLAINGPSAEDYQHVFTLAGLTDLTGLNDYDAFAAIQFAMWSIVSGSNLLELDLLNCGNETTHPKQERLQQAALSLAQQALAYGLNPNPSGGGGGGGGGSGGFGGSGSGDFCNSCCGAGQNPCGIGQIGRLEVCNTATASSDQSEQYLIFVGCPNEVRSVCGRVLIGPFRLESSASSGTPTLSAVSCCGGGASEISVVPATFCGEVMETPPTVGEEFYIFLRPPCCTFSLELTACMETTANAVYFFASGDSQPVTYVRGEQQDTCTKIHIRVDLDRPAESEPNAPPPWLEHILINNNNNNNNSQSNSSNNNSASTNNTTNNNNNNNNNNSSNSFFHGFMRALDFLAPHPPYPPYPQYPPLPPNPQYPPLPPYPPFPQYLPYPPYPSPQPFPPYPPAPSYPPAAVPPPPPPAAPLLTQPTHLPAYQICPLPVPCTAILPPPIPPTPPESMPRETPAPPSVCTPVTVVVPSAAAPAQQHGQQPIYVQQHSHIPVDQNQECGQTHHQPAQPPDWRRRPPYCDPYQAPAAPGGGWSVYPAHPPADYGAWDCPPDGSFAYPPLLPESSSAAHPDFWGY